MFFVNNSFLGVFTHEKQKKQKPTTEKLLTKHDSDGRLPREWNMTPKAA